MQANGLVRQKQRRLHQRQPHGVWLERNAHRAQALALQPPPASAGQVLDRDTRQPWVIALAHCALSFASSSARISAGVPMAITRLDRGEHLRMIAAARMYSLNRYAAQRTSSSKSSRV